MESPRPYEYRPLRSPRFTRLLVLHCISHDDPSCPLTCRLEEMDMRNPSSYFALSYTWNDESPSEPLLIQNSAIGTAESAVNGQSSRTLLITSNCAMALRLLQSSMSKQWRKQNYIKVWIDAICINQQSSNEKGVQVAMMADIYRGSESVVVWLGQQHAPPSPWSLVALQPLVMFRDKSYRQKIKPRDLVLKDIERGNISVGDMALGDIGLRNSGFHKKTPGESHEKTDRIPACRSDVMRAIAYSSYWTRVWTLQEFASPSVSFLCRDARLLSAGGFIQLFNNLCWEPDLATLAKIAGYENFILHWQMHNNLASAGSDDGRDFFMGSLIQTEQLMRLKTSEPGDKIFALRALSARTLGKISIDYERPTGVLFAEVTKELIKAHKNPELLYFASIPKVVRGTSGDSMPSWAVDFGVVDGCFLFPFTPLTVDLSKRAMSIHADITLQFRLWKDSQRLSLMGARIGEVGKFVGEGLKLRLSDGAWVDQYGCAIHEPLHKFISSVSAAVASETKLDRSMGNSIQKMLREIWTASGSKTSASEIPAEMLDRGLGTSFEPWYQQNQFQTVKMAFIFFKKSAAETGNTSVKDSNNVDTEYVMINGTKTLKNHEQDGDKVKQLKEDIALLKKQLKTKDAELTSLKESLKISKQAVARLQQHCAEMIARA
ncbi:HET domain-containing protein [Colletotrichum sojae]|uniref:HET domain-containing protein n=1 Tax=Colletotrichum sojae TaxID=2175907 RepID=A0A8H6INC3_9PEZI|nr:HET domain-containing protein [Colletotrichum sojae]